MQLNYTKRLSQEDCSMTNPAPQRLRDALRYVTAGHDADARLIEAEAAQIEALYGAEGRYYHTLDHAIDVAERSWILAKADGLVETKVRELVAAALYHDIIYTPGALENEERSAAYAIDSLPVMGVKSQEFLFNVYDYVMATKYHDPVGREEAVISDADLWLMGEDWYTWANARTNVFREFGADPNRSLAPAWLYRGRVEFLEELAGRDRLFFTGRTGAREVKARANIAHELRFTKILALADE
jgi:predicted metal-dependent HD superfamily phosphohydrolase